MKLPFTVLLIVFLAACARASDSDTGTALVPNNHGGFNVVQPSAMPQNGAALFNSTAPAGTSLVPNNHGGYNVVQPSAHAISIPFFGSNGYASHVIAESRTEKPKFILKPVGVQDDGHGGKHPIYKKIWYPTAEAAEAARLAQ
jgi:hypothetical protein